MTSPGLVQVTSTTVPGSTGNCVVVSILFSHKVGIPVQTPADQKVGNFFLAYLSKLGGGGGKALTMTMTPWNLPHGQWSKKLTITMATWNLPWSMIKIDKF